MRVLHIAPFYEPAWGHGGMARAASGLCRALVGRGHQVSVLTTRLSPEHPLEEVLGGARVRRFEAKKPLARWLIPWAPGLARLVSGELPGIDVAHLHGHRTGLAAAAAGALKAAGVPWLLQPHGTYPNHGQHVLAKRLFDRTFGARIVAGAQALLAVSAAEAGDLPRPATLVPNGVAIAEVPRPPRGATPRLLFVGSDRPQKRAAALPALLAALPEAQLEMVGPVDPRFVSAFGPDAGRVVARGVLEGKALAEAYAAADLVVHPAVGEGFGLVPFEAALLGTAAVVAGGHGCGEWFSRAGGCVVPPDDAAALLGAVRLRLAEPQRAAAEVRAVAAFARGELTWERAALRVEEAYREAIAARRRDVS